MTQHRVFSMNPMFPYRGEISDVPDAPDDCVARISENPIIISLGDKKIKTKGLWHQPLPFLPSPFPISSWVTYVPPNPNYL